MSCEPIITNGTNPRLHGSALLALDVICPRGTSIPGQYEMFGPQTSLNMTSATSLRALEDGPSPCNLRDTDNCPVGRDRRHASHSPLPASSADLATKGTSRPSGLTSSRSAVLQSSLASRLQTRLGTDGSTIYSMRWKSAATPAGRQYCQLVASARRTSAKDCSSERSGWPTPCQQDGPNGGPSQGNDRLPGAAALAGWPTPTKSNADGGQIAKNVTPTGRRPDGTKATVSLNQICQLSGWPTPNAGPQNDTDTKWMERREACKARHGNNGFGLPLGMMSQLSGWPSPHANSTTGAGASGRDGGLNIQTAAQLSGWPTPTTRDHKDGQECPNVPTNSLLDREVWKADRPIRITASGQVLTGSDAGTASSGQLNPAHSRWLMGYPPEWDDCGVMAMPSSRKSQPYSSKNSSAQQSKYQAAINAEHAHV